MMNHSRYFLPHLLASPRIRLLAGMNTGLKSYRCKVFDKFPRTQHSGLFSSWGEYEKFHQAADQNQLHRQREKNLVGYSTAPILQHQSSFASAIIPMRADETIAIAALIQATVAKLYKLHTAIRISACTGGL